MEATANRLTRYHIARVAVAYAEQRGHHFASHGYRLWIVTPSGPGVEQRAFSCQQSLAGYEYEAGEVIRQRQTACIQAAANRLGAAH